MHVAEAFFVIRAHYFLVYAALLAACSSSERGDDDVGTSESKLTEVGTGVEIARCWFETNPGMPPPFPVPASTTFKCKATVTDGAVFVPPLMRLTAQHPDDVLHQVIGDAYAILPVADAGMTLNPTEFPLEGRFEARLQLASQAPAPLPSMQAVDGRGAFSQSFRVATFAEASSRGIDNPYVIKVPFATWLVRIALPAPAPATATLVVAPYRVAIAPWSSADAQHRDSLELQVRAASAGTCLATHVIAPNQGEALSAVLSGLGAELRASIDSAGDFVADVSGGSLRRATAEEAAAGPCAPGRLGAACDAGACTEGACVGGLCQAGCGVADGACCGTAATAWAERCGKNSFCKTSTSICVACGTEGKTCCPDASGAAKTCGQGLTCNAFERCQQP